MFRKDILNQIVIFLQENGIQVLLKIFGAIGVFLVSYIISKWLVNKVKNKIKNGNMELNNTEYIEKIANLIGNIIFVVCMIISIFIVFAFLGMEVSLVLGGLSIAVGFAMETTIKNMIAGLFLLTNKKSKLGDFVEILGKFQLRGIIEEVTMRNTVIRTIGGRRVIIPNGELGETPIKTVKAETMIRGILDIHVPRYVNIDQVKNLLLSTINTHTHVLNKEYTTSIISGFDNNGFSFKSFFYYNPQMGKSGFVINSDIRIALSKIFKKYGIKAPYEEQVLSVE